MHPRTRELLDYLDAQRAVLRAAFDEVPPDVRHQPPAPGRWSPVAIVEHLAIVNGRIAYLLRTNVAKGRENGLGAETSGDPILPSLAVEHVIARTVRVAAPEMLHPSGLDATAAWEALERSTVALREAVAAGDGLALSTLAQPHPLLGPLSLYHWIAFAGAHEARHAAQIRECITSPDREPESSVRSADRERTR
jgi:DinB family protein